MYEMSQPEYGYSAKVSVDQFANSVNASNPGIYEIPLVHTDAKGRLWTTNQGSEEQLPMLDGVKLPITMFGRSRWSGPGRRFRYDFPALSSMIRGVLSPGTGTPDDR